jgi:predicted nucleic acid-binding protein
MARRQAAGRPMSVADAFIAATVEVHGLTLVTRNAVDFEPTLKGIINPWT